MFLGRGINNDKINNNDKRFPPFDGLLAIPALHTRGDTVSICGIVVVCRVFVKKNQTGRSI